MNGQPIIATLKKFLLLRKLNSNCHQLARGISKEDRHFSRLFASSCHTTPGNYILSLRMQHAGELLKNTTLSIAQVAFQSGFNDSNYFSRQFRKFYNASPRDTDRGTSFHTSKCDAAIHSHSSLHATAHFAKICPFCHFLL